MHYPILLETELANRWKLSFKTLRAWRQRMRNLAGARWGRMSATMSLMYWRTK